MSLPPGGGEGMLKRLINMRRIKLHNRRVFMCRCPEHHDRIMLKTVRLGDKDEPRVVPTYLVFSDEVFEAAISLYADLKREERQANRCDNG